MNKILSGLALSAAFAAGPALAQAPEPVQMAGSSTVLPYAQIVAENFSETYPDQSTPIVESGGTGGGFTQFCAGIGGNTIDIANASRPISANEKAACAANGVAEIQEVQFGYDGIVFASSASGPDFALTPEIVFSALAAKVVVDGEVVDNPHRTWADVDASLPDQAIATFIPAENHGTREVFEVALLEAGCEASGALAAFEAAGLSEDDCIQVRGGNYTTDISGDYTETLSRISANPEGVGVFGLAFYEQNQDRLKVATIDGVTPSVESISTGEYPVSRPLYFYVKTAHLGVVPGLEDYVSFFLDDQMIGPDGPLAAYGLVPAPDAEREEYRAAFQNRTLLQM
ncbi:substrate-binding domain-containing protein [Aureimonas populi]|uniref:Substrate-binding domain-containing protein n=1 Tax=Aureimonas populi TaxID=1701758 RepID=A0ABW5CNP5_9HYPH|nr:substrate-binding domain-containing protein [Aureimonas populi]